MVSREEASKSQPMKGHTHHGLRPSSEDTTVLLTRRGRVFVHSLWNLAGFNYFSQYNTMENDAMWFVRLSHETPYSFYHLHWNPDSWSHESPCKTNYPKTTILEGPHVSAPADSPSWAQLLSFSTKVPYMWSHISGAILGFRLAHYQLDMTKWPLLMPHGTELPSWALSEFLTQSLWNVNNGCFLKLLRFGVILLCSNKCPEQQRSTEGFRKKSDVIQCAMEGAMLGRGGGENGTEQFSGLLLLCR